MREMSFLLIILLILLMLSGCTNKSSPTFNESEIVLSFQSDQLLFELS